MVVKQILIDEFLEVSMKDNNDNINIMLKNKKWKKKVPEVDKDEQVALLW